jgi:hypothetical protein
MERRDAAAAGRGLNAIIVLGGRGNVKRLIHIIEVVGLG